jgi:uncharacterized protein (DUF433 family)
VGRPAGHRIGLYHFVYYYNQGFTAEMILCQFPTLELATIHKVIAFYLDHRDEVDRYVADYQAELDQLRAAATHAPSVSELRKLLETRQTATALDAGRAWFMALGYLLDENLRGPLWAALHRANARRSVPLEIACVGEQSELPLPA